MSEESLPTVPVHRSLIRPDRDHLLGAERDLLIMLLTVAFILGWMVPSVPTIVICVLLLTVGITVLREMAKRDPSFSRIVTRRLGQQREYQSHASVWSKPTFVRPQQKND